MSQIFDALQRSESERAGTRGAAIATATELLERAERDALLQRKSDHLSEGAPAPAAEEERPLPDPRGHRSKNSSHPPNGSGKSEEIAPRPAILDQFRTQQLASPIHPRLVALTDRESPTAEAFRLLGVRLRQLRRDRSFSKLLITSTTPQEGKSTISANLACTLATGQRQRVLLVEGDIRRPSQTELFGLNTPPGICEYLRGDCGIESCIQFLEQPGFWLLPAGTANTSSLEVTQSSKIQALVDQLASWFQWVIIDSPPVLPLADTSVWARCADAILLVTRNGITQKRKLLRGLEAFDRDKLIGAILNSSTGLNDNDYYYYYDPQRSKDRARS